MCISRISLEPLELHKSYLHLFASLSKEVSDDNTFFQIWVLNKLIFAKSLFCQKKSKLLEKIRHFEKIKNFFSWIEGLGIELTYKQYSGSKIVTQPL